jgi:CheY-like chemotaxis protein
MMRASAQRKGLELDCIVEEGTPLAFSSDRCRTREVLINLIGNAIKYTDAGNVRVTVGPASEGNLQFTVADTGPGIPDDHLQKIFNAFQRGDGRSMSSDGAGLGLAISRQLVELLGGTITAEKRSPRGALFRFTIAALPKGAAAQSPSHADPERRSPKSTNLSAAVLLAEDDDRMRDLTRELLEQLGCNVAIAQNGLEAFSLCRHNDFDIVLMDCSMPLLGGIEATRLVREHARAENLRPIPIIALTANAFASDRAACLEAGMNDFLSKPFTRDELREVLLRNLKAPAAHPEVEQVTAA